MNAAESKAPRVTYGAGGTHEVRDIVLKVTLAILALLGTVSGYVIEEFKPSPPKPVATIQAHYELWSPSGLPKGSNEFTYRIETNSGRTWRLGTTEDKPIRQIWIQLSEPDTSRRQ